MIPSENAPVTILFTDILDAGQLAAEVGDDTALDLRRRHFRLIRDAVAAAGGHEVKNLGDGLMVTFGSAVAGIEGAVDIQQRVQRHNAAAGGAELRVRVGINIGEPIRSEEDYFGTPVNVARRLCDIAEGGQILTTGLVRDLVGSRGEFAIVDAGSRPLKGLTSPVEVCEVRWQAAAAETFPLPRELEAPARSSFVGRAADMERLATLWPTTAAGGRQLVLLAGEPGIGKSRLAREFAVRVHDGGGAVLFGRCDQEAILPFQPLVEVVRGYIERCSPAQLRGTLGPGTAELGRLVPELESHLPDLAAPLIGEPENERFRLFQAISELLAGIARTRPTLLIVDDLHWADRPTLLALRHVLSSPGEMPLMVLGSYRDFEVDRRHPLSQLLVDIRRTAPVERIDIGGLSIAEVEALLKTLPDGQGDAQLATALQRNTEGNPFFIEEIVRHLTESGASYDREGRWTPGAGAGSLAIPESVRDIISRRLAMLKPATSRILSMASVLGREFDLRVLQGVADAPMADVLESLAEAVEAQALSEVPGAPGRYAFSHALVRQALYEDLGQTRRVRLHQRAGATIEALHAAAEEEMLPALAYHFAAAAPAGDYEKAVDYALRASRRAVRQLAYEEAVGHLEAALKVLDAAGPDASRRCQLLLALGDAQARAGDADTSRASFAKAAQLARSLEPELLADAAIGFGGFSPFGDVGVVDATLVGMLEEALAAIGEEPSARRCRLLARLAIELYWEDSPTRREELGRQAVDMARQLDDNGLLAYALDSRIMATWGPDTPAARRQDAEEMAGLAADAEDLELMAAAYSYRSAALLEMAEAEEAYAAIDELDRISRESSLPSPRWQAQSYLALRAILEGRLDEGERLTAEAFATGQNVRTQVAMQTFSGQIYSIRFNQGRLDELESTVADMADEEGSLPIWRAVAAHLYVHLGRGDDARRYFDEFATADFENLPRNATYTAAVATLAEVCYMLDDAANAPRLYSLLEPYVEELVMLGWGSLVLGAVAYHMGTLAVTSGDWERAEANLDIAAQHHGRLNARPWSVRTEIARARLCRGRKAPGDAEAAEAHLLAAAAEAEKLGLGYLLADIRQLQAAPGAAPPGG
ncbi:MAG TPA: AAA family ATPase [Candidatus Dormibacteraeota bacterium]|nr:AAA family ATPase [Candidatus Dormibacteraeota bacterium]